MAQRASSLAEFSSRAVHRCGNGLAFGRYGDREFGGLVVGADVSGLVRERAEEDSPVPAADVLNAEGRTLLGAARGQRLSADLMIVKSSPAPAQALAENVRLVEVKAASPKRG